MRKTSVYIDEDDSRRLKRLANDTGLSQAEVIRSAIKEYQPPIEQPNISRLSGCVKATVKPIDEIGEDVLLQGFGES